MRLPLTPVRARLALFAAASLAFAYACSSDPETAPAGVDGGAPPRPEEDAFVPPPPPPDAGPSDAGPSDAGDASTGPTCVGNPLTADGGTVDGGVVLDAAVATRILDEALATGLAPPFVDGPQYLDYGGGSLVFSELYSDPATLVRISTDGGNRAVLRSATTTPLAFFIGNAAQDGVILTTLSAGDLTAKPAIVRTLPDGGDGGPSLSVGGIAFEPNDLAVGPKGDIYFTDPQYQVANNDVPTALYRRQKDGGVFTIVAPLDRVNGIALSPGGAKLYVTITDLKRVLSFDVAPDGTIVDEPTSIPTTVVRATADAPDGVAVDVGGNLWLAEADSAGGQSGRVEVYTPGGKKLGEIPFPGQRPTGLAFGGPDDKTLFVTTERGVWVFSSRCAGLR